MSDSDWAETHHFLADFITAVIARRDGVEVAAQSLPPSPAHNLLCPSALEAHPEL